MFKTLKNKFPIIDRFEDGWYIIWDKDNHELNNMKKRLLIMFTFGFLLISILGCSKQSSSTNISISDKPNWTEKQVISYLYDYVISKSGIKPSKQLEANKGLFTIGFQNLILNATIQTLKETNIPSGTYEPVKIYLDSKTSIMPTPETVDTSTNALKTLAKYKGNGIWIVNMGNDEWSVSEVTQEVTASNKSALKILEDISHDYYQNTTYHYKVRYPAGWQVVGQQEQPNGILIANPDQLTAIIIIAQQNIPEKTLAEVVSLYASNFALLHKSFNLTAITKLDDGNYSMDFEWQKEEINFVSRNYFIPRNNFVYMISGSTPKDKSISNLKEFDYAYNSFTSD